MGLPGSVHHAGHHLGTFLSASGTTGSGVVLATGLRGGGVSSRSWTHSPSSEPGMELGQWRESLPPAV